MKLRSAATYQFLPKLTDGQYEALRGDIAANGIRHPIVVDEKGLILDGHHRSTIAQELGIEQPPHEQVTGLSEQEKRDLVFTLNGARRHMTREQLREFVVRSLMADPQLSDRQHARRTGVTHPTVAAIRTELRDAGRLESFTSRLGADGRERPASQPPRVGGTATSGPDDLLPDQGSEGPTDVEPLSGTGRIESDELVPRPSGESDAAGQTPAATPQPVYPKMRDQGGQREQEDEKSRQQYSRSIASAVWTLAEYSERVDAPDWTVSRWDASQDIYPKRTNAKRLRQAADFLYALAERWSE